jgi:type II secretory pathway component GspD/PulD (secretin)
MNRGWIIASLAIALAALPRASANAASTTRRQLSSNVPAAKFENVPLSDCFDFLSDVTGANIVVDWKTLTADNIPKDTPVDLRVKNLSLRQVLSLVLNQAGNSDHPLSYYTDRDIIYITTKSEADKHVYTIIYDVRDLLITVPNFTADSFNGLGGDRPNGYGQSAGYASQGNPGQSGYSPAAAGVSSAGSASAGQYSQSASNSLPGGYSGQSPYGGNSASGNATPTDARAQSLIKLIETVIQPTAWSDNGGTTAYIAQWNGSLIVTAPQDIQEAIGGPIN